MKHILLILLFILQLSGSQRIVSLSPSITEILFALGAGEEIVATSSYSLYPKEAQSLPVIGGYHNPSLEKIIIHKPTLVIGQHYLNETLTNLEKFHIKTLELHLETLQDIQSSIIEIAKAVNKEEKAKELNKKIDDAISNAPKVKKSHSVMIVYGLREDISRSVYIAGKNIFFDDIITACGNDNVYTDGTTAQPVLNYENILALNPDQVIILHSLATEGEVDVDKALKNWYSLPINAAKDKKISIINENYLHNPSNRVALTIEKLCSEMNR